MVIVDDGTNQILFLSTVDCLLIVQTNTPDYTNISKFTQTGILIGYYYITNM
jgi:hypothetical protein